VTDSTGVSWARWGTGWSFEAFYGEGGSAWEVGALNIATVNHPSQQAGPPLALWLPADPDPFYIHYFLDNIQSARRLRLDDRSEVGANEYTPYGAFYNASGMEGLYKFAGHIHDNANGMYWAPFRWYDPEVARWTTRDPLGMIDGPNVYEYVIGNPIVSTDPLGLLTREWCEDEYEDCKDRCKKRRSRAGRAICYAICMDIYAECIAEVAVRDACSWIGDHPVECTVGAIVIIGGVAFVVVSGGSGACVLVPLAAA